MGRGMVRISLRAGLGMRATRGELAGVLVAGVLAVQAASCGDGELGAESAAPSESGRAASAVSAAHSTRPPCADAGTPPEQTADGLPVPARSSCTVNLTRRGEPLTIEYQIK